MKETITVISIHVFDWNKSTRILMGEYNDIISYTDKKEYYNAMTDKRGQFIYHYIHIFNPLTKVGYDFRFKPELLYKNNKGSNVVVFKNEKLNIQVHVQHIE